AAGKTLAQRLFKSKHPDQPAHGGGLTTGQHQRVHVGELIALPHGLRFDPGGAEGCAVLTDVTLEGKNAYSENCRLTFSGRATSRLSGACGPSVAQRQCTPQAWETHLPAASGEQLLFRQRGDVQSAHGGAETGADVGDDIGLVEVGGGGDYRLGVTQWIVTLEDAAADEVAVASQLHHQRRIRRSGDATSREVNNGELAALVDLHDEVIGRAQSLGFGHELVAAKRLQATNAALHRAHVAHRLDDVARSRLALGADHRGTLADAAECLAEIACSAYKWDGELPF